MSKENSSTNFNSVKQLLDETIVMFDIIKPTINIVKLHLINNHAGDQYCQTAQQLITLNDALRILEEIIENLAVHIPKFIETVPAIHPKDKMSCFAPHIKCVEVRKSMIMLHLIKQFYTLCINIKDILSCMTLDMPVTSNHHCYRRGLKRDSTNGKIRNETTFNLLKKEYKDLHHKLQDLQKYADENNYEKEHKKASRNELPFKQFVIKCKDVLLRLKKSKATNITTELVLEQLEESKKRIFTHLDTTNTDLKTKSNATWTVQNYKSKLDTVSYDFILTDCNRVTGTAKVKKSIRTLSSVTTVHCNILAPVEVPTGHTDTEVVHTRMYKETSSSTKPVRYKSKMNSKQVQNAQNVSNIKETWNSFDKTDRK
ncbi:hypothetical protein CBL_05582 [Carabus blaptoides fortunei]